MAQEFIKGFHEIQGLTIPERQKNLNILLKYTSLLPEQRAIVLDNLKPKTNLESLFYIDVLIYLRETNRLLEIFKNGNGVFVSKIMKQSWFFQEVFNNVDAKELVDVILPLLSFTVKIKLLRRLSEIFTEKKVDEVFDYTARRYGLFMATGFITACSTEKITQVLKNNKVILLTPQLKLMHKKDRHLINVYLEEQKQYKKRNILNNNFLKYLAQKDPVYFWELLEKQKINRNLKLGRRTTKKLIPIKQQDIINDPKKYIKHLRQETLVRKLNKQGHFKQLYYNAFPRDIQILDNSSALCNSLLKYYPKRNQYYLFTKTFNAVLKEDIWCYTNCIPDDLLKFLPDKELREAWAQLKYQESGNAEYLKFFEIKKSIPLIKEKINTTSSTATRSKLLCLLVKSCAINKDLKTFEEILKYFCARHRNDSASCRTDFLRTIEDNLDLKELNETHWKYITEILTIQSLNNEPVAFTSKIRIRHIEYLFDNNGSEDEKSYSILEYIRLDIIRYGLYFPALEDLKNLEIKKTILLQTVEHIGTIIKTQNMEESRAYLKAQLFAKILLYNLKHPKNKINFYDNNKIIQTLRDIFKELLKLANFSMYFTKTICKLNRNEAENEFLKYYLHEKISRGMSCDKAQVLLWYLKNDPQVVVDNLNGIMQALPQDAPRVWKLMKLLDHLSLSTKVVKHCVHELTHGQHELKSQYVLPISILSSPTEYIKVMEDLHIPFSSKLNVQDEDERKHYELQKILLQNFKNIDDALEFLPLLLDKFCQGDYLQVSLAPLYYGFYNTPENKLKIHLDTLKNNNAMSVKKHALFLASVAFDQATVMKIYNLFQETKNESLQKCLCLNSLKNLTKTSNQEIFEKLLLYMKFLKGQDTESLEILADAQVPTKYKPIYVVNFWNLLESLKMNTSAVGFNKIMTSVLKNIDSKCIAHLPQDFCKGIITKHFLTNEATADEAIGIFEFVIQFLLHHQNQTENFTYIFTLLSNYKMRYWDLKGKESKLIFTFFDAFYVVAYDKKTNLDFVTKFCEEWQKIFTPIDTFKENILMNLLKFKKETENDIEMYAKYLVQFAEQINVTYGEHVFSKFIPIFAKFCFENEEKGIELMTNILKYKTVLSYILILETLLFKGNLFYQGRINPVYREIDFILKNVTDPKIQLCYNLYVKI